MHRRTEEAPDANKHWIGEVQPTGVVVTATALAAHALVPAAQTRADTEAVLALLGPEGGPALPDSWAFLSGILGWRVAQVGGSPGGPELPDALRVALPASDTVLEPQLAVAASDGERGGRGNGSPALCVDCDGRALVFVKDDMASHKVTHEHSRYLLTLLFG